MKNFTKKQYQIASGVFAAVAFFLLMLVLSGCTGAFSMLQSNKPLPDRLDDAKILITAASQEITEGVSQGYYLKDEARPFVDQLDKALLAVKNAEAFLATGDLSSAEAQYKIADAAMTSARNWLRSKSRQKGAASGVGELPNGNGHFLFRQEQTV